MSQGLSIRWPGPGGPMRFVRAALLAPTLAAACLLSTSHAAPPASLPAPLDAAVPVPAGTSTTAGDDGQVLRESDLGEVLRLDGYVPVEDGTLLRLQIDRPKTPERVPTLLIYQGYTHLVDFAADPKVGLQRWASDNGYALMMVTTRGTGCSAGGWDLLAEQEALDARDLIDWIAGQQWSDGKVAMIGESYAGLEQLRVASLAPAPLVAIAPGAPMADLYRDVVAPGGIPNALLPAAFTAAVVPPALRESGYQLYENGDDPDFASRCLRHQAERAKSPTGPPPIQFTAQRWDDDALAQRSPAAHDIALPMLALVAWQDELLGSRAINELARMPGPVHAVLSNGDHTNMWTSTSYQKQLRAFLDFYVKGIGNGFDAQERIQVWWETTRPREPQTPVLISTPGSVTGLPRLPAPHAKTTELHLSHGGQLTASAGNGAPDAYLSVPGNGQARDTAVFNVYDPAEVDPTDPQQPQPSRWTSPAGDGFALAYTSPPLGKDVAALGSASVDLSISSNTPDTDVQVVLTEVRPDGQEMYVQAGWLRASHRAEDLARSQPTRPFHTHRIEDTLPLVPGTVESMRIEINPFGHVFRTGSSIRLWIEAPAKTFGLRSLEPLPFSSRNQVHHDQAHPSVLRLATLPGQHVPRAYPTCGSVIRQPCRTDPLAGTD